MNARPHDPDETLGPGPSPAERADALIAMGRHADAIPWLERAIAEDPQAVGPRCRLALAFVRLGDNRRALAAADRAHRARTG